ncbi:MAG: hypothetical protein GC171_02680 [Terrimonas sp.]|nr:hypothetical protein [Terrimonas sp.]
MKKILVTILFFIAISSNGQHVEGYWYGNANVKVNSSASNYLVELILKQEGNNITGVLSYYFKNTFRSFHVKGTYNPYSRLVFIKEIPISYYGSSMNMDVDCIMDFAATLRVAKVGSSLNGSFQSLPQYKYTCPPIDFSLKLNKDISNQDSVAFAIRTLKESFQVWKPDEADTLVAVSIQPRKVINYYIDNQYKERTNELVKEIEVDADSVQVDFYDNGEIDGDSISVFFNNQIIAFSQRLSTRSIHFDIPLDTTRAYNEISMFAENLGLIPPNTALMIVNDGKKKYELRLTSDLQKNATIRLRRKR